ncbi:protein of unknown function (plasmid) [Caballeronia sp. S22]
MGSMDALTLYFGPMETDVFAKPTKGEGCTPA